MRRRDLLATPLALAAAPARAQPLSRVEIGARAPDFTLPSAQGRRVRLSSLRGRPVVLEWAGPACPYTAKKYAEGAMQAAQAQARGRGLRLALHQHRRRPASRAT